MRKAVYPGSFDLLSNGHLDLIKRASKMFDELHILVSNNIAKKYSFTVNERIEMIKDCTKDMNNVVVASTNELVVKYCKEQNINVIIRGMRNYSDYESEFSLFQYNRDIYPEVETILLMPTTKNQVVSSSAIKELVTFGCDIHKYVPKPIVNRIIKKFTE
ncbi:MAG: pantetheine-phosphate adenylyltransferase [Erysipelotrichaceae bacterium]|nr:pantetheine-phosphate adenylyltransferase [Erysipelotrichaceae bacterium]